MSVEVEPPVQRVPQSITEHWPQVGRFRLNCELHGGFARPEERRGWSGEGKAHTSIGPEFGHERIRQRETQPRIAEGERVEAHLRQRHRALCLWPR